MAEPDRLCIHQVTLGEGRGFGETVDALARAGVTMTAVWRPMLEQLGIDGGARMLRDAGVSRVNIAPPGFDKDTVRKGLDAIGDALAAL